MFSPFESQLLDSNWKCLLIVFKEDADKIPNRFGLKRSFQPSSFCDFLLNSCFCLASLKQRNIQKHAASRVVLDRNLFLEPPWEPSPHPLQTLGVLQQFSHLWSPGKGNDKPHLDINFQSKVWRNWKGISSNKNNLYIESRIANKLNCLSPTLIFGRFFLSWPFSSLVFGGNLQIFQSSLDGFLSGSFRILLGHTEPQGSLKKRPVSRVADDISSIFPTSSC